MADKNSQGKSVNNDSGLDIDLTDLEDISLEDMDDFEGIDFENLELDDIDFDDLDVTNLDTGISYKKAETDAGSGDDFDFGTLLAEDKGKTDKAKAEKSSQKKDVNKVREEQQNVKDMPQEQETKAEPSSSSNDVFSEADKFLQDDTSEATQDDIDAFLASLNSDSPMTDDADRYANDDYSSAGSELDDLFKQSAEISLENGELDDIEDRSGSTKSKNKKAKRSFSEILFGEPDEDDEEEERLLAERKAQKEIKKAENAEKKAAKKAEKDAKKKDTLAVKDKANRDKAQAKAKLKAEKKAKREAEYLAELEEDKDSKPMTTKGIIFVFAAFALLALFVIFGTKSFDYNMVIKKATDYFGRQKYSMAYDEIAGVEVKSKDEELKDRIYTVMYVDRLYESYENNMTLGRTDKALDALIRGLEKYDEHYEEAVELDIAGDIDTCKQKIIAALNETFSMTEEDAYAVMEMDGQDYNIALANYAEAAR